MRARIAVVALVVGCATPPPCAGAPDDDAASAPDAASVDALARDDAALACSGLGHAYLVELRTPAVVCQDAGPGGLTVDVFSEDTSEVSRVIARCVPGTSFSDLGPLRAGRHRLAIRYGDRVYAGGTLLGAVGCDESVPSAPCRPIVVDVRACDIATAPYVRPCTPGDQGCL